MITNENGKLAKKALTKVKIKLILLQKLVEDYELYNSIHKITTDGSSTVDYINTCIDSINEQLGSAVEKNTEVVSITDTEIEELYTTQINEIKSSITTLLSEIEGYIGDHC